MDYLYTLGLQPYIVTNTIFVCQISKIHPSTAFLFWKHSAEAEGLQLKSVNLVSETASFPLKSCCFCLERKGFFSNHHLQGCQRSLFLSTPPSRKKNSTWFLFAKKYFLKWYVFSTQNHGFQSYEHMAALTYPFPSRHFWVDDFPFRVWWELFPLQIGHPKILRPIFRCSDSFREGSPLKSNFKTTRNFFQMSSFPVIHGKTFFRIGPRCCFTVFQVAQPFGWSQVCWNMVKTVKTAWEAAKIWESHARWARSRSL